MEYTFVMEKPSCWFVASCLRTENVSSNAQEVHCFWPGDFKILKVYSTVVLPSTLTHTECTVNNNR